MIYNQSTNSLVLSNVEGLINQSSIPLIHQLTNLLINQSSNSPINLLQRARKYNKNMQNKANSPSVQDDTSPFYTKTYKIFTCFLSPKNKAKQSQFKPNFSPKLASFFPKLALFGWLG